MKHNLLFIMLIISFNLFASGAGSRQSRVPLTQNFDRYLNGMPVKTITNDITTNYEYLGNGLIIIDYFDSPSAPEANRHRRYLLYNEFMNENIISEHKLNEFMEIMELSPVSSMLTITENYNEITRFNKFNITVESRYDSFRVGQNRSIIQLAVLVFDNETNRLTDHQYTRIEFPIIHAFIDQRDRVDIRTQNYEYTYNDFGRLESVSVKYNDENIVIKKYYYDGILRYFEKPFFADIESPGLREIIIYENDSLKYQVILSYRLHHYRRPETIEIRDSHYYYIVFQFDENRNEITQTKYFSEDDIVVIYSDILDIDKYGNWTQMRIHSERSETLNEIIRTTWEYVRDIIYE